MVERHWKEVNKLCKAKGVGVGLEWSEAASFTLKEAKEAEMEVIGEDLLEIAGRANRELSNYNVLEAMETEWREIEIRLKSWKETKTYVIQGDCVDEL